MKTLLWGMVLLAGLAAAGHAESSGGGAKASPRWLMMVATLCTNSKREADFNTWYNDIDIPDVLEVPGYQRARRGIIVDSAVPEPPLPPQIGRYVALYNIDSEAIDKTLIDMLMATRKMESRQRSTDLLKVTERVYYHESAPAVTAIGSRAVGGGEDFLFLERVDCCADAAAERRFNHWYEKSHLPQMLERPGMQRATRYELYRVLMIEEQTASKYLTVFELTAPSLAAAQREADNARQQLLAGTPADDWTTKRSILYRQIRDVRRPAGAK